MCIEDAGPCSTRLLAGIGCDTQISFSILIQFRAVDDFNGFCALGGYFNREMRSTLSKDPWRKVLFKEV